MSEPREDTPLASEPPSSTPVAPSAPRWRGVAFALAGALLLVVLLVVSGPYWVPLLPWDAGSRPDDTAIAARIDRLAAAQQQQAQRHSNIEAAAVNAALQPFERRLAALEARPAAPSGDIADLREQLAKLSRATADLEARSAALDKIVQAQTAANGDLTNRLTALDKTVRDQRAIDTSEAGLVVALLQIRDAVAAGRPFATEYRALMALAPGRPDIAEAAAPLAESAASGVASHAVLAAQLREVAVSVAAPPAPPAAAGWTDAALARLRGLVTVRRIDGAGNPAGPDAAIKNAERALAGGDLGAAVAALDRLTDAAAQAAAPWLRMAKARLAVEAALHRIEALLLAKVGNPAAAPTSPN
ncbi:MAG TPA: hypothetical protein VKQ73_02865 [Stellaceae bacterium]|nr:hypothetical protein [Stellaceae bacterium]